MNTISDQTTGITNDVNESGVAIAAESPRKGQEVAFLTRYEQARTALAHCARVDEAKSILDKAEPMRVYAKQLNNEEFEAWAAEIKLRAMRRIGEICLGLEKARPAGGKGNVVLPPSGSTKSELLDAAGLSVQTANRCEKVAAIPVELFEAIIAEKKAKLETVMVKQVLREVALAMKKQGSDQPKVEPELASTPEKSQFMLGVGERQTKLEIECLKKIPMDDPSRGRGLQIVTNFIKANP